jgi:hypothetical protein
MIFFNLETSVARGFPFFEFVESQFRFLSFHSGLFIVAISFFLFGWQNRKPAFWRWFLFLLGILLTQYNGTPEETEFSFASWKWGLFSYLAVAYLLLWLSWKMKETHRNVFLLSSVLLFFVQPYQISALYSEATPALLKQALTGDLIAPQMWTGWYLIPWIAYPMLFAGLGSLARKFESHLRKPILWLDSMLPLAFAISLYQYISSHPDLSVGPKFDRGIFHKDFLEALPIILLPLLFFRWSFLQSVQNFSNRRMIRWISELNWNRHFWLCYLLHLIWLFCLAASPWAESFKSSPAIEVIILFAFLLPETYAKAFVTTFHVWQNFIARWKSKKAISKR